MEPSNTHVDVKSPPQLTAEERKLLDRLTDSQVLRAATHGLVRRMTSTPLGIW